MPLVPQPGAFVSTPSTPQPTTTPQTPTPPGDVAVVFALPGAVHPTRRWVPCTFLGSKSRVDVSLALDRAAAAAAAGTVTANAPTFRDIKIVDAACLAPGLRDPSDPHRLTKNYSRTASSSTSSVDVIHPVLDAMAGMVMWPTVALGFHPQHGIATLAESTAPLAQAFFSKPKNFTQFIHPVILRDVERVDRFLYLTICAAGLSAATPSGGQIPNPYYDAARAMAHDAVESRPSLAVLQATILLATVSFTRGSLSVAWQHVGMASSLALYLGLDKDADGDDGGGNIAAGGQDAGHEDWIIRETRRRCWWTCRFMDREPAAAMGIPPTIPDNLGAPRLPAPLPSLPSSSATTPSTSAALHILSPSGTSGPLLATHDAITTELIPASQYRQLLAPDAAWAAATVGGGAARPPLIGSAYVNPTNGFITLSEISVQARRWMNVHIRCPCCLWRRVRPAAAATTASLLTFPACEEAAFELPSPRNKDNDDCSCARARDRIDAALVAWRDELPGSLWLPDPEDLLDRGLRGAVDFEATAALARRIDLYLLFNGAACRIQWRPLHAHAYALLSSAATSDVGSSASAAPSATVPTAAHPASERPPPQPLLPLAAVVRPALRVAQLAAMLRARRGPACAAVFSAMFRWSFFALVDAALLLAIAAPLFDAAAAGTAAPAGSTNGAANAASRDGGDRGDEPYNGGQADSAGKGSAIAARDAARAARSALADLRWLMSPDGFARGSPWCWAYLPPLDAVFAAGSPPSLSTQQPIPPPLAPSPADTTHSDESSSGETTPPPPPLSRQARAFAANVSGLRWLAARLSAAAAAANATVRA
ncbi:hypothetical protein HK405_006544 [Cladochytrium tenue]|nr:hypothetical protein HK405_006544 [Cladochytrium tenue]